MVVTNISPVFTFRGVAPRWTGLLEKAKTDVQLVLNNSVGLLFPGAWKARVSLFAGGVGYKDFRLDRKTAPKDRWHQRRVWRSMAKVSGQIDLNTKNDTL